MMSQASLNELYTALEGMRNALIELHEKLEILESIDLTLMSPSHGHVNSVAHA